MIFRRCLLHGAAIASLCLCQTAVAAESNEDSAGAAPEVRSVTRSMTLAEASELALQTLQHGDVETAVGLGRQVLQFNPNDTDALFVVATAELQLGNYHASRIAAARAYRTSDDPRVRLRAAQLAATAAIQNNQPTLSQLWLRRAATNTSNGGDTQRIAADYARLRKMNPLSFRLTGSVTPSNNVNNGANSSELHIDGVPTVGDLSSSAQALPGTLATTDVEIGYRIAESETGITKIGARMYVKRVSLSSKSKEIAKDLSDADLDTTYLNFSMDRNFLWGSPGNTASVGASLGRVWAGNDHYYDLLNVRGTRSFKLGDRARLNFGASLEGRQLNRSFGHDQTLASLTMQLNRELSWGDSLGLSFSFADVRTQDVNQRRLSSGVYASYQFAKAWGPARVTASLAVEKTAYRDYQIGWIAVPGGRQDLLLSGDLFFFFKDYTYAGFAPAVRLHAGRRQSNVSRFDSDEISVSFEIRSIF